MKPGITADLRRSSPLWLWVGLRMTALAIATVITIALGMWAYFQILDAWAIKKLPPTIHEELLRLRQNPHEDEKRLWEIYSQVYKPEWLVPGLDNPDWLMLLAITISAIPIIVVVGFSISRPLSQQFSLVAKAAKKVSHGNFATRVEKIPDAPGELSDLAKDFNDMTSKLQQYEREVRESSAIMAHELRTPLNAAMGRIQGMLDEVFPLDSRQLELILRQLKQINLLVGDLHLISLARAGQMILEETLFSLTDLINERLEWSEQNLEKFGIETQITSTSESLIYADRDRLGQLISILIDNVIRYAAAGKTLEVTVAEKGASMEVCVSDRGPGVQEEDLRHMLDRFWRADSSRARHSGGSGLGLAIAAAICQAHAGAMECRLRPSGGLTVVVRLPIEKQRKAAD